MADLQSTAVDGAGTSLYVHVPFCVVKCGYCDFNSYVADQDEAHERFLAGLAAELERAWPAGRVPKTVFFGGGTPSLLSEARLERLLRSVDRIAPLCGCAEVTLEANPESITATKAAVARAGGVSRFSMGVQTFHPHHLRFLDRAHSAERAEQAFGELRAAGATNLSVDLMFGIPGETFEEWVADLERALALRPEHLSCYNLTFEPGTRLYRDLQRDTVAPNDQEVDRAMFEHTRQRLAAAGFTAYEVSNFAGRGGACQHNEHYWLQGDYVGVGPGASSHRCGVRWTNLKALEPWAAAALAGLPCAGSAETLRPRQRLAEAIWLGIRRSVGVDLLAAQERVGVEASADLQPILDRHLQRGYITWDGRWLRLTAAGLLMADQVGGDFLGLGVAQG